MQDKPGIHLSVIIPAYNEENRLPNTLDAVLDYLGKQSYTSEVLIVDDGSKHVIYNISLTATFKLHSTPPVTVTDPAHQSSHPVYRGRSATNQFS